MVGSTAGCCARAASGHAAATPPSSVMNSRRLMLNLPLQSRFTALSACHRAAGKSYGADVICSELDRAMAGVFYPPIGGSESALLMRFNSACRSRI
jgi:hypothetical protein